MSSNTTRPISRWKSGSTQVRDFLSRKLLPSVGISLGVHLLILLSLAFMMVPIAYPEIMRVLDATTVPLEEQQEVDMSDLKFDVTLTDTVGNENPFDQLAPSATAAQSLSQEPPQVITETLEANDVKADFIAEASILAPPEESDLLISVKTTGTTEQPGGVEGAIDRLTFEIASSLREQKTLVVWLFDASLSLKERRKAIAGRFENVYRQLGAMNVDASNDLKTAVVSFGGDINYITTEPVSDATEIVTAVQNIEPDTSGNEFVFGAVDDVSKKWSRLRTRDGYRMMIIVVTDERGDDFEKVETVTARLRRQGIHVYCIGNAAVFGREKNYVTWTYPDGSTEELPVDQGPETVAPERLQLAFWGIRGRDLELMSASFGPYALTRLCAETGGLYLITEDTRGPRFDLAVMRNYRPDYRPISTYQKELGKNRAKQMLVQAASTVQAEDIPRPQLSFRADTDTVLRQQLTEAQKPLAVLDYQLQEMHRLLTQGESDRDKLETSRWRASFDLAYGRVLAMRVRAYGYNVLLAEMKTVPKSFEKEESNKWDLRASDNIDALPPQLKKMAEQATAALKRVIDEHPSTPWSLLAERELSQPLGWEWREGTMFIPQEVADNRPPAVVLAEQEQQQRERQQRLEKRGPRPAL